MPLPGKNLTAEVEDTSVLQYKSDWPETRERFTALWEGRTLDRPYLGIMAPNPSGGVTAPAPPEDPEARWLDPAWVIPDLRASLANNWWGGDVIPSYLLMAGWVLCYGATPRFSQRTIWHEPFTVDYDTPPNFTLDLQDPWISKYIDLYSRAAREAGKDNFLLGTPCLIPANDLLPAMLGTTEFLLALVEHPEWIQAAMAQIIDGQMQAYHYFETLAAGHDFPYGNPGWMPFWAPREYRHMQSDVSCMLSPAMFDEFVVPELERLAAEFESIWYHLDGFDACQHLPRLLATPGMRVIQYVPTPAEPNNGPDHLELYRTIQHAGKIIHITVEPQYVEPLVKALDPALLLLLTYTDTIEEGEALLAASRRWMG